MCLELQMATASCSRNVCAKKQKIIMERWENADHLGSGKV